MRSLLIGRSWDGTSDIAAGPCGLRYYDSVNCGEWGPCSESVAVILCGAARCEIKHRRQTGAPCSEAPLIYTDRTDRFDAVHVRQHGRVLHAELTGKTLEKGHQYGSLPIVDLAVELGLGHHAHRLVEGRHRAVVKIRRGESDVAQRRHPPFAGVRPGGHAFVVAQVFFQFELRVIAAGEGREPLIERLARRHVGRPCQRGTAMAADTAEILELFHAGHGVARERAAVAAQILVEWAVRCDERALISRQRSGDVVESHRIGAADHLVALRAIAGDLAEAMCGSFFVRRAHLDRIEYRAFGLLLLAAGAAVPELSAENRGIPNRGGRAGAELTVDAYRYRSVVGAVARDVVAGVARHRTVDRQARIEEKLLAQRHLCRRGGIVGGSRRYQRQRFKSGAWRGRE